jgi:hypothetical protein
VILKIAKFEGGNMVPEHKVSVVVIDGRVQQCVIENLANMNIRAIKTLPHPDVYPAIAYHPDIMLHPIGKNKILCY